MQTMVLILMTSIVYGQDIIGEWKGTLSIQGNQLAIIFYIKKANNQYEVTLDSPDQNVIGIKVTGTEFRYPKVKFEISDINAVYEGTLSEKSISGKWLQSGTALFLAIVKKEDASDKGR